VVPTERKGVIASRQRADKKLQTYTGLKEINWPQTYTDLSSQI